MPRSSPSKAPAKKAPARRRTSAKKPLIGSQTPRIKQVPRRRNSVGPKVVGLATNVGLYLDDWQGNTLGDALSVSAAGKWLTPHVAVAVPRQNGKGGIIEAIEVAFLLGVFGDAKLLIHSAHEYKTAQNGFQRLLSYFDTVPALANARETGRVKISTAAAREYIIVDGRKVAFMARSKGAGRGFSADILILDEAQELSDDVWAAILPTVSARPNPQIWLFGTPPSETMNGEVFTRFRENALAGTNKRLAYFEWSAPDDADPSLPATWAQANPAYGLRIDEESVRDEYLTMDEDTFGRERLGQFDVAGGMSVIPEDTWEALASESDPSGRVAFAIDVAPDRSKASIGVAGFIADERPLAQVIENRKGTGWVADRTKALLDKHPSLCVVIDSGGPAASLVPDLRRAGVPMRRIKLISTREVAQACGSFYDLAMQGRLAHCDQPVLNEALAVAKKRPLGDAFAWHRKHPTADLTPLVAVTFAVFGLLSKPTRSAGPRRAVVL